MNKSELEVLLKDDATPIYKLEQELGMPPTTLQKALTGGRNLPKKWALKLKAKFTAPEAVEFVAGIDPVGGEKGTTSAKLHKKSNVAEYPARKTKTKVEIQDLTKPTNVVKPITDKPETTNIVINTEPPRLKGENSIEYRIRMAEFQTKKQ